MRRRVHRLLLAIAPFPIIALVFVVVLRLGTPPAPLARHGIPREEFNRAHCTWYCHNHGCDHRPALGEFLAGDDGLFGWTVRALHSAGDRASPGDHNVGYGAMNLIVFCGLWPGAMYALYLIALRQRFRILDARAARAAMESAKTEVAS